MERKDIVVGGLGNPLMTDEGIGIYILQELKTKGNCPANVDLIDLGSSAMNVVHAIAGRQKAVLIDCACMEEVPGTIRKFSPNEVVSTKTLRHFSLHEGNLMDSLELSQRLGEYPHNVVIFGIQPESMLPGEGLSPPLQERLADYTEAVIKELNGE